MCNQCYGKGVIHQINGFTGITTIGPCHCNEPNPPKKWISDLIKNSAEYNQKSEQEIKELIGV